MNHKKLCILPLYPFYEDVDEEDVDVDEEDVDVLLSKCASQEVVHLTFISFLLRNSTIDNPT